MPSGLILKSPLLQPFAPLQTGSILPQHSSLNQIYKGTLLNGVVSQRVKRYTSRLPSSIDASSRAMLRKMDVAFAVVSCVEA